MEGLRLFSSASCRLGCFSTARVGLGGILSPSIKWKGYEEEGMLGSVLRAQPRVCPLHLSGQGLLMSLRHQGVAGHKKMVMRTRSQRATATMMTMMKRKRRRPT